MPKNIPGIVKRSRRRQGEKVRILIQPNPYPLEQPGGQPNVSGPTYNPQNPQMQPNGSGPLNPQNPQMQPDMQQGGPISPVPQPMQQGGFNNTPPLPGQVVPMQSSGQWHGDPNAQTTPPFPQGGNQPWQGGTNGMPGNNQPWPANSVQQPMTPPQMQRPATNTPPYSNNMPMQQGRGTPPPADNISSQPPYQPGQTPEPQYSPQPLQRNQPMANQQHSPVSAVPQGVPVGRMQSNSGLLGRPSPASLSGIAGAPTLSAPVAHIFVEIDGKPVQEVRLDRPVLTVGRQDGRDIQIKHQSVSRTHARIVAENGRWFVEDAGSVNGIVFNGQRVQRTAINNGDRIFVAPNIALLYKVM